MAARFSVGLRRAAMVAGAFVALAAPFSACGDSGDSDGMNGDASADGAGQGQTDARSDADVEIAFDGAATPLCVPHESIGQSPTDALSDPLGTATVTLTGAPGCERAFQLASTAKRRDDLPSSPRTVRELAGWPTTQTGSDLFDALYALALEEVRENSVDAISDGAFNGGQPLACPPGGCFETGRLWKYVWTRDTAYATRLGLAALDPRRSKNSLEFKISDRRTGGLPEIVQDTGSGGSYPVSSDRVTWAMGAWEVLKFLSGPERTQFRDRALEALRNTIDRDRQVVYDPVDRLYRGEQSFLDWREQTYGPWTSTDVVPIAASKTLSTNIAHLRALEVLSGLGFEAGDAALASRVGAWATDLRTRIHERFKLPASPLYSTMIPSELDPAPLGSFDLLGSAFVVLHQIGNAQDRAGVVAAYPHLPLGAPVIWPAQKLPPIYHNRADWPFVTAFWALAARQVRNDAAVDRAAESLVRGAALNLSNMENLEMVTGAPWVDDGPKSGPTVNSQRQLWSVAAYVAFVHSVVFGADASQNGIRFLPYVTRRMRHAWFQNAGTIVLNNFPYRGRFITVVVRLPAPSSERVGAYTIERIRLNGVTVSDDFIPEANLGSRNWLEVILQDRVEAGASIQESQTSDAAIFAPNPPNVTQVAANGASLVVGLDPAGEPTAGITFDIYRDGQAIAKGVPGSQASYVDATANGTAAPSHCYAVQSVSVATGAVSHRSRPVCYWGAGSARVQTIAASAMTNVGGSLTTAYGKTFYQAWGDPGHALTAASFTPSFSGPHWLQVVYGNGSAPVSTGITCGVKRITVYDTSNDAIVGSGKLVMPATGDWSIWRDSTVVPINLSSQKTYRIVIDHGPVSDNMSSFSHFGAYGGAGGAGGALSHVNIAELKLLARSGAP